MRKRALPKRKGLHSVTVSLMVILEPISHHAQHARSWSTGEAVANMLKSVALHAIATASGAGGREAISGNRRVPVATQAKRSHGWAHDLHSPHTSMRRGKRRASIVEENGRAAGRREDGKLKLIG
jgi:hypothetical protein